MGESAWHSHSQDILIATSASAIVGGFLGVVSCGNYYHYYRKHRFYNKVTKKGDISAFLMASGYQFLAILFVVAICLGLTCGVQDATYTWQIMAYGGSTLGGIILVGFLVSPWASNDDATTTYH